MRFLQRVFHSHPGDGRRFLQIICMISSSLSGRRFIMRSSFMADSFLVYLSCLNFFYCCRIIIFYNSRNVNRISFFQVRRQIRNLDRIIFRLYISFSKIFMGGIGKMWMIAAIMSAVFAGLTAILAKCGIKKTDSDIATALHHCCPSVCLDHGLHNRFGRHNIPDPPWRTVLSSAVRSRYGSVLDVLFQSTLHRRCK